MYFRINSYSRTAAVNYALKYALKPNPDYRYFPVVADTSGDCTNFTSQCLYAGGAPMIYNSNYPWWYKHNSYNKNLDTWSVSWTVAHSFYWFLKVNNQNNSAGAKGLEVNNVNLLELGDLIFYENDNGMIFHSAIVTGTSSEGPLISQHSFEAANISYLKSWKSRHMHFLKIRV
ncbi:MAG: amidase domain-containing protein [Bacillota bacterium]|nr:amidase domain-containing protein [Bacillota bacterium]